MKKVYMSTRTIKAVIISVIFLALNQIFVTSAFAATDTDSDGVIDSSDNCILIANPLQRDTDNDSYGNFCDPDFSNDLIVASADLAYFKSTFFTTDPDADLNGDGIVNAADLAILKPFFFQPPGPSYIDLPPAPINVSSNLPDTGLKGCYNSDTEIQCPSDGEEFYGQDAQYSSNTLSYTNFGEYEQDNVTGLMWKLQHDHQPYNWYEATGVYHDSFNPNSVDVCGALSLGGYNDWRVPSRREFSTIFYFGAEEPGLAYLSVEYAVLGNLTLRFWTSSELDVNRASSVWGIAYGGTDVDEKQEFNIALCVRGPAWNNSVFVDNLDGTVTDQTTKLMWQQDEDGIVRHWKDALLYCQSSTLAEYDDWRLPNVRELDSLINLGVNSTYFPNANSGSGTYWSSTTAWEGLSAGDTAVAITIPSGTYSLYEFQVDKDWHYQLTRCVR